MKPKVIKASLLVKEKATIRRKFKAIYGCDLFSQKAIDLGSDEYLGGDIYDDLGRMTAEWCMLDSLQMKCKEQK